MPGGPAPSLRDRPLSRRRPASAGPAAGRKWPGPRMTARRRRAAPRWGGPGRRPTPAAAPRGEAAARGQGRGGHSILASGGQQELEESSVYVCEVPGHTRIVLQRQKRRPLP